MERKKKKAKDQIPNYIFSLRWKFTSNGIRVCVTCICQRSIFTYTIHMWSRCDEVILCNHQNRRINSSCLNWLVLIANEPNIPLYLCMLKCELTFGHTHSHWLGLIVLATKWVFNTNRSEKSSRNVIIKTFPIPLKVKAQEALWNQLYKMSCGSFSFHATKNKWRKQNRSKTIKITVPFISSNMPPFQEQSKWCWYLSTMSCATSIHKCHRRCITFTAIIDNQSISMKQFHSLLIKKTQEKFSLRLAWSRREIRFLFVRVSFMNCFTFLCDGKVFNANVWYRFLVFPFGGRPHAF